MSRFSTIPILLDQCKTLSISKLKEWGYIQPYCIKSGTITWSIHGERTGRIGTFIDMNEDCGTISFNYLCDKEPINYQIEIISKKSNLGFGLLWFFKCPQTGQLCRKLYLADTYLLHRTAFTNCMYDKQTRSKKNRVSLKLFNTISKNEDAYEAIYSKNFKKSYNGQPTKKYLKMLKTIKQTENITVVDIERMYLNDLS